MTHRIKKAADTLAENRLLRNTGPARTYRKAKRLVNKLTKPKKRTRARKRR